MAFPEHLHSHWYVVCLSHQLGRKPRACTVLGQHLVLFRDGAGRPAALLDRCPHRNAPLSKGWVHQDQITCPYHGWRFDQAGQCQAIPGKLGAVSHPLRCVTAFPVVEEDGFIWVLPRPGPTAEGPPPPDPLSAQPGYTTLRRRFSLEAPLLDALENFLDPTHTHFVHAGLVRADGPRRPVRVAVRRRASAVEAEYRDEGQQTGLIARIFGGNITHTLGRFLLPSTVQMEYWSGPRLRMRITLYFTPEDETRHQVFVVVTGRVSRWLGWLLSHPLSWLLRRAARQDQRILALQMANVRRFGGEQLCSTELDLLRPHIARLLEAGPRPTEESSEKQVIMQL